MTPEQEENERLLKQGLIDIYVPAYMRYAINSYVNDHKLPGDFLQAVLKNNLREAVTRADTFNLAALEGWILLLHNYVPRNCWGSPKKVEDWVNNG